jgi:uncharacterized membrane protein
MGLVRRFDSFIARLGDLAARWSGKPMFLVVHVSWWTCWVLFKPEPFPFGLLTLIVSLESILLSGLILASQNREGEYDRALLKQELQEIIESNETNDRILAAVTSLLQHRCQCDVDKNSHVLDKADGIV